MKKPLLSELTLREKIGQTVAMAPKVMESITDVDEFFKKNPFGNMWTAGHMKLDFVNMAGELTDYENINYDIDIQIRRFCEHVSKFLKAPFLSALDAETGCFGTFPYFSKAPSSNAIGATQDPEAAYEIGKRVAHELKLTGCSWVWSPVCDNASPFCSVSLTRSFTTDMELAKKMIVAYIKGVQSEKVAATLKHFPGTDKDEYRDSHFSDQVIRQSLDQWYERQGVLFKTGIDNGVDSVMITHGSFPACDDTMVDGRYLPATLSKKIVTGLLKEKLGFKGVAITDAIGMRALSSMFTSKEDFYSALYNAGNDVILGPTTPDFIDIVEKAVLDGKIPESRIDDACQRVLDLKERVGLFTDEPFIVTNEMRAEAVKATNETNKKLAPKIITWLARKNDLVPLNKDKIKKVKLVFMGYSEAVMNSLVTVKEEFAKYGAEAEICEGIKDAAFMEQTAKENDLIIYFAHLAPHSPYGVASFVHWKATQFMNILGAGAEKSICVSTGSPYVYHDWFPSAKNFLNLYCNEPELLKALVRGLYGECEFTGVCPVNPDPLAPRL